MMFASIAEKWRHRSIWFKAVLCAGGVTAVEFIFGLIFNVWLQRDVWDYSNKSFNVMGQICPVYSLLWGVVALGFIPLAEQINRRWKV